MQQKQEDKDLLVISALFVILVGPSRVYLGDHWASDVLGTYIFGVAWLGISLWVYLNLKGKGVLAPRARRFHEKYVKPAAERPKPGTLGRKYGEGME